MRRRIGSVGFIGFVLAGSTAVLGLPAAAASPSSHQPAVISHASASSEAGSAAASIHPGSAARVKGTSCEIGLLLHRGSTVYAGFPASCIGTDDGTQADGCDEAQFPAGTHVRIAGARHRATEVYSSFTQMQLDGTRSSNTCNGNNLALARLSPADARYATPHIPSLGRPVRASSHAPADGATLAAYLSGRRSATAGASSMGGWHHSVTISGQTAASNLGAPVVNQAGRFLGMETVLPTVTSMNVSQVGDLARELRFLRRTPRFRHIALLRHRV